MRVCSRFFGVRVEPGNRAAVSTLPPGLPKTHAQSRADFRHDPDWAFLGPLLASLALLNEDDLPRHPSHHQDGNNKDHVRQEINHCASPFDYRSVRVSSCVTAASQLLS